MTRYEPYMPVVKEMMAAGAISGARKIMLRGRNQAISTSDETVWEPGGTYAQLTAHAALEVISSSANDAAAGTGTRTVRVRYIDANYVEQTEIVTLNGTSAVAMAATSSIAVNALESVTTGSNLANVGNIDVRTVAGSVVKSRMATPIASLGSAKQFVYTIPEDHVGILGDVHFSATGVTGDLTCYLLSRDTTGMTVCEGVGKSSLYVTAFNGAIGKIQNGTGLFIPERTQIELRAVVSAGAGDLVANAELFLFKKVSELGFPLA